MSCATNIQGGVPVIRGFNLRGDTLGSGAPVAVIGFPLGGAPEAPGATARVVRPLVSSGVISEWRSDRVELEGYGAAGASGSPIFSADGRVIALLFGGTRRDGTAIVYALPAEEVARLLNTLR
jgi:S1-C subfamily serine protease